MVSDKQAYFKMKIKAFLHDFPERSLLFSTGIELETRAKTYLTLLFGEDESYDKTEWKYADQITSGVDGVLFPTVLKNSKDNVRKKLIITHPLSGGKFQLSHDFEEVDLDQLHADICSVMKKVKKEAGDDYEKLFLLLWSSFTDKVQKEMAAHGKVGSILNYLPADINKPDHSMLDHCQMVSAFAGAGVRKKGQEGDASFFLFTIGPVQEFIAAARKTSDLWSGSYLLSWLSWEAMKVVCEEYGPDSVLFPDLKNQPLVDHWLKYEKGLSSVEFNKSDLTAPTLPNRFFAVIPTEDVKELGIKAESAVLKKLKDLGDFTWDEIENYFPNFKPNRNYWDKQLSSFIEVYWSAMSLPELDLSKENIDDQFKKLYNDVFEYQSNQTSHVQTRRSQTVNVYEQGGFKPNAGSFYGRLYELVEKSLGARKGLRDFSSLSESGYRCSLIPSLASLAPGKEICTLREYDDFWKDFYNRLHKSNKATLLKKNERLSPIALSKRLFPTYIKKKVIADGIPFNNTFVSTHNLSVADFKLRLIKAIDQNDELGNTISSFVDKANQLLGKKELNLQPEEILKKQGIEADKLSSKNLAGNLCRLPGELFQLDYYDGIFKDDLPIEDLKSKIVRQNIVNLIDETRRELKQMIEVSNLPSPSKYYALLYLDGDNMGSWLSGENSPEFHEVLHPEALDTLVSGINTHDTKSSENQAYLGWARMFNHDAGGQKSLKVSDIKSIVSPQTPTQHLAISRALNHYSLRLVRPIVEEKYLGKLIYAGGDDVVAMVSLGDALACATDLRALFSGHIAVKRHEIDKEVRTVSEIELDFKHDLDTQNGFVIHKKNDSEYHISSSLGQTASASCGMAIVHYMYPLKQGMADARKAEKFAKNELGRDAFAVNIVKRSGEHFISGAKWRVKTSHNSEEFILVTELLDLFSKAIEENKLSSKFIVDLEEVADILDAIPEAIPVEVKRLFNQHNEGFLHTIDKSEPNRKKMAKEQKEAFYNEVLMPILNTLKSKEKKGPEGGMSEHETITFKRVIQLLDMAFYIGKGGGR